MSNSPFGPSPFQMEEAMRSLRNENARLREQIDYMMNSETRVLATVIDINEQARAIRFMAQNAIQESVVKDSDLFKRISIGCIVYLNTSLVVQDVSPAQINAGVICKVLQVLEKKPHLLLEIQCDTTSTRVIRSAVKDVKPGDRGQLDFSGYVFIRNFGSKDTSHVLGEDMLVTFDDVGGQDEAKRALLEAVIDPVNKRAIYDRFGKKPSKGALLWGPPGTGKTMLAKALANALAKLHGTTAMSSGFIYIKGPELLNKFIGETESNIRKQFASARAHWEKHHYPAILFFDEADALLGRRGSMHPGFEGIDRTVVPQFLSEMDGLRDSGAFVLLATNRPDILDPAVVRDGRIDRKVHVKRPDEEAARIILKRLLDDKPCKNAAQLAAQTAHNLYSNKHHLWDVTTEKQETVPIHLGTIASGAMIASLVERATLSAIREDADAIVLAHLDAAIVDVEDEQRRVTHDLNDFADALDSPIVEVKKIKPGGEEKPEPAAPAATDGAPPS